MRVQGDAGPRPLSDNVHAEQPHRQGMLSSKGLWTLELELPDLKVIAMSDGLKEWCTKQQAGAEEGAAAAVPVGHLCDIAHPDDEFALRKAVADQKMAGTRLSLRLEQRSAPQDAESAAGSKETKETPGKKQQAGKQSGKGKQEKKDETSYLKVDMLLAGITVGTRRLVLVSPRVSEPMQVVQEVLPPASLQHQQQRWHKREQRLQHRVQAHELDKKQQQHELAKGLASAAAAAADSAKQPADYIVEVKAEDWSSGDASIAANAQAAAAAAAAAAVSKLLQGQHSFAAAALAAPAADATDASATPEARAAAAAFGPGLAGLAALLNAGGAGGDQKAGLDGAGLGPLLQMAAMQMSLAQQQMSASGEGSAALTANANAALLSALASTQLAPDGTVPAAGGAALPAPSSEGIMHYLTALAALSVPGGAEGTVLYEQLLASAGLVGGVKGKCGKVAAGVGGIKGAKGKPVPKGKGKAEKGKKSSPFEAEEVEVAATLALLRNPNPAVVARAQGGLDASGSAESYSSMVSAAAAAALAAAAAAVAAKGKGGAAVGLKKEAKRGSGAAGDMMRRASDCSDDGDDAAPSGAMVCMLSVLMHVPMRACAVPQRERSRKRRAVSGDEATYCHAGRPGGSTDAAEEDAQAPEDIGRRT
jgi:hypothetical protein